MHQDETDYDEEAFLERLAELHDAEQRAVELAIESALGHVFCWGEG